MNPPYCPACGTSNPARATFCGKCGKKLAAAAANDATAPVLPGPRAGQDFTGGKGAGGGRRWWPLVAGIAVLVAFLIAGGGYFAYTALKDDGATSVAGASEGGGGPGKSALAGQTKTATVTSTSAYEVRDGDNQLLASFGPGQTVTLSYTDGQYRAQGPGVDRVSSSYVKASSPEGGIMQVSSYHDHPQWNPSLDDNAFRGAVEIRYSPVSDAVWVVNELNLESYLRGIGESSKSDPEEYKKAATIAARSYALSHVNKRGKYGPDEVFHLKNSRNGNGDDQRYQGYSLESRYPELGAVVDATRTTVVTYGSPANIVMTPYFSNSDGRTRSAEEVWGMTDKPWLVSVPDPDCQGRQMEGHGVGMSSDGARARASRGEYYYSILAYYYPGTSLSGSGPNANVRVAITSL